MKQQIIEVWWKDPTTIPHKVSEFNSDKLLILYKHRTLGGGLYRGFGHYNFTYKEWRIWNSLVAFGSSIGSKPDSHYEIIAWMQNTKNTRRARGITKIRDTNMSKYIELAKKLKALAERGEDGERANAQALLKRLMHKHGITADMIEQETTEMHYFNVDEKYEWLLLQICAVVMQSGKIQRAIFPKEVIEEHSLPGNIGIICTSAQCIEIDCIYSILQPHYEKEVGLFRVAFLYKHNLLYDSGEQKQSEYTTREQDRIIRIAQQVKKETVRKQIQ